MTGKERRQQLLDVARALFAEKGFDGTSIEEIAHRAGVSKPVVYEHFGGKEGVYAVVVDREMEEVIRRITVAISTGTPRMRIEQAAVAFLSYVEDHPYGFAVLSRDAPPTSGGQLNSLLNEVADRVGALFAEQFKRAGYDRKAAPIYAHALVGMVSFVGRWWVEARKPSVERVAAHIGALAWMGLRHLPRDPELLETD